MIKAARFMLVPGVVAAGALATVAVAAASAPKLRVSPSSGAPSTPFLIHFRAAEASGRTATVDHWYIVQAIDSTRPTGCVSSAHVTPLVRRPGQPMAVKLNPAAMAGGRWCAGTFSGNVIETSMPNCGPPVVGPPPGGNMRPMIVCPMVQSVAREIGTFSFTVR